VGTAAGGQVEDRRERLVKAAIELFSERPYDEVSVQEIAAKAGAAIGLVYYHFTDKQGLYVAGLEQLAEELRLEVREATSDPRHSSALDRLLAGLKAQLEFVEGHPTIFRDLNSVLSQPQIQALIERERGERLELASQALPAEMKRTDAVEATLEGWLHFVDGVQIAWLQDPKLTAEQVCELCCRVLFASAKAAADFKPKP
jgi:AcrR family transcriptional regulator